MTNLSNSDLKIIKGGNARLWHFSPSHDRLTFRITKSNENLVKFLVFLGCEEICTTVFWKVEQPLIEKSENTRFKLVDGKINIYFEECRLMDDYVIEES